MGNLLTECGERSHGSHWLVFESELVVGLLVEKGKKLVGEKKDQRFKRKNNILTEAWKGELNLKWKGES